MEPNIPPYHRLGGAPKIHSLVNSFYRLMEERPELESIRRMHDVDLSGSRDRLFAFLSGWLGGPPLFAEKYGPPMLRRRHLNFSIGVAERDQWLTCIRQALEEEVDDPALRSELYSAFAQAAEFVRNRE